MTLPAIPAHVTLVCLQYDEGKLDTILKDTASTEPPADAPAPPPEEADGEENNELLPSQRDQGESTLAVTGVLCCR